MSLSSSSPTNLLTLPSFVAVLEEFEVRDVLASVFNVKSELDLVY